MNLIRQPDGSSLCGQSAVAMAAGVSLDRACEVVGHRKDRGTTTKELINALRELGVPCANRLRPVKKNFPTLPKRGILVVHGPQYKPPRWHWVLIWDGDYYDPGGCWPEFYKKWHITSYLEIFSK